MLASPLPTLRTACTFAPSTSPFCVITSNRETSFANTVTLIETRKTLPAPEMARSTRLPCQVFMISSWEARKSRVWSHGRRPRGDPRLQVPPINLDVVAWIRVPAISNVPQDAFVGNTSHSDFNSSSRMKSSNVAPNRHNAHALGLRFRKYLSKYPW